MQTLPPTHGDMFTAPVYPSLSDLLPLLDNLQPSQENTAYLPASVVRQRDFVGYRSEEVNEFREKHLERANRTIKYINKRVKQRLQRGVRTRTTIQLGHLEVDEYFCIFHAGNCGKIRTGTRKCRINDEWGRTKVIIHAFDLKGDRCDFDMKNEYTKHGIFPYEGLEVTHVHKFWVEAFRFVYFPELCYAEVRIVISRDVERTIREFERLIE
jgi:hypothetical protein